METPFPAYNGDDDFVFTCYSHRDSALVYTEIADLHDADVNIWYDEGIQPGSEWTDELAAAIRSCKSLLFFATPQAVKSKHCRDEVQYALKYDKPIIVIYLEPTELPPGLDLMLGSIHAVEKGRHEHSRYLELIIQAISQPKAEALSADSIPIPKGIGQSTLPRSTPHVVPPTKVPTKIRYAIVISLVIALIGLTIWWNTPQEQTPIPISAEGVSVALLPFENRGGFETDNYYPESFSEDLLNRLVAIEGIRVASRRSSFNYDVGNVNTISLPDIAEHLGVGSLVIGYIRRTDNVIRLGVELIDISSGNEKILWSDSYDNLTEQSMLSIQNEVTRQIGNNLISTGVSAISIERLASVSTDSPEAYASYLQATNLLRSPLDEPAVINEAVRLFNTAITLDPEYTWAKAGLCNAMRLKFQERVGEFTAVKTACEALADVQGDIFEVRFALGAYYKETGQLNKALAELQRAVQLNEHSADARLELARVFSARFALQETDLDRVQAERAYLDAIAAEPDYWYSHHSYASFLTQEGRLQESMQRLEQALRLEPISVSSLNNLAAVQYRTGQTQAAETNWNKSLTISSDNRWAHAGLGILYHYAGRYSDAVNEFVKGTEVSPTDHEMWGRLGESLRLLSGREEEAISVFRKAIELAHTRLEINETDWEVHGYLAVYYAYANQPDKAQAHLDKMFAYNAASDPMKYYWAALVAYESNDIDTTFQHLDEALKLGFARQKRFIIEEPALANLRNQHAQRFSTLLSKY